MNKKAVSLFSALASCLLGQTGAYAAPLPDGPTVLITDQALDGSGGKLRNARIHIAAGKIVSLSGPVDATVVDLRGYTVLPGWIDAHVHIASHFDRTGHLATAKEPQSIAELEMAEAAWATLQAGFTTIQSVGDPSEGPLRDAIR